MLKYKYIFFKKKQKKQKPGSVAFYKIRPGNGAGLFSKEKMSKEEISKKKVKKKGPVGKHTIQTSKQYI